MELFSFIDPYPYIDKLLAIQDCSAHPPKVVPAALEDTPPHSDGRTGSMDWRFIPTVVSSTTSWEVSGLASRSASIITTGV